MLNKWHYGKRPQLKISVASSRLHICLTCIRDHPLTVGESSLGRQLFNTIKQAHNGAAIELRTMHCLNGCRNPCNAAFRGEGKFSLRFSRLVPADAPALLDFAILYAACSDGVVAESEWPQSLRGKLSARTPPPRVLRLEGRE